MHNGQQALQASQSARPSSVHGTNSYWRVMRAAATALRWKNGTPFHLPSCSQMLQTLVTSAL